MTPQKATAGKGGFTSTPLTVMTPPKAAAGDGAIMLMDVCHGRKAIAEKGVFMWNALTV